MADITKINLKGTLLTIKDQYAYHNGDLATVATSGSYNDLQDKPNIPAGVTVDQTITQNGTNPVRGSAIYSALATKMQRVYIFMENNSGTLSFTNINGDVLSHQDVIAILKNNMNNVVLIYDRTYVLGINEDPASERTYWWFSYINNANTANKRFIGLTTDDEISIYIDDTSSENLLDAVVPVERKVNNKQLSSDITLNASDVGALPSTTTIPTDLGDLTNNAGYTKNTGTITGITMNGVSKGTSGVVDLGTVITAHQDISGKANASDVYTKTQTDTLLSGKQNTLTFDNAPTSGSNNPVKSGGVYTALAGKQNTLTFDSTPTASSANPVTSGGVKTYVDGKASITGITTNQDGTFTITLSDGNSYTVNLNHVHPQYLKYELLADEAAYTALATKDSSTLYLIPES